MYESQVHPPKKKKKRTDKKTASKKFNIISTDVTVVKFKANIDSDV